MLDMLRVFSELTNQSGIVRVSVVSERLLPLQHDHRETVRIGFFEVLAHAHHGLHRRRVSWTQWYGMLPAYLLQRRNCQSHNQRQRHPSHDDEQRQPADRPRCEGDLRAFAAHEGFNRQKAGALTLCEILAALTTPSARMRHPMLPLSPCATTFPTIAGPVLNRYPHLPLLSQQQCT